MTDRTDTRRLFVAVPLPEPARSVVADLVDGVRAGEPERSHVRWVRTDGLHLTLRFLGAVSPERATAVSARLADIAAATAPIAVVLAGAGAFPSAGRPRVLWLAVAAGADELVALAGEVSRALVPLGWPAEERSFRPHLTLARADAGQTLELRPVELDRIVLEAVGEIGSVARNHHLELKEIEPSEVSGDADRLKQLVLNLLDNSIKYTPPQGRVFVTLKNEAGTAVLSVEDTGVGIPEEDLPHVFERFYRADKARGRDPGGSGLGLSIAAWIVDQHEGEISIDSTPALGTTVTVRLPLAAASPQQ